jgi:pimeloyl-ACP methyl ester carboxylesterase
MDLAETFPWEGRRIAWGRAGSGYDERYLTEVDGAGHLIQLDAPVALATALRSWLTAQNA